MKGGISVELELLTACGAKNANEKQNAAAWYAVNPAEPALPAESIL